MGEGVTARLVEGLQAGELDVVLASLPIANPETHPFCFRWWRQDSA